PVLSDVPSVETRGSGPMKKWKTYSASLALAAGFTPSVWAQIPVAPAAPAGATGVAAAGAAPAPAPAPATLWSFLGISKDQMAACKAKLCQTPLGGLLNNMLKPVSAMSGGLVGPCCPTINVADLAKPADSAEGAAARVQADEAG